MAISTRRFTLLARYKLYSILSPFTHSSSFATSSLQQHINNINNNNNNNNNSPNTVDESKILNELSDLIPTIKKPINLQQPPIENDKESKTQTQTQALTRVSADGFLSIEDKLRGVFIQRLKGRSLIENALSNVIKSEERLDFDVFCKVLDGGNLGGECMVLFFNWAVEKGGVCRDLRAYNVVLKSLGRRKFFEFMMGKFREMFEDGLRPSCDSLMIVLDSFVRVRRVGKALEVFGKLDEFGMECDTEALNVLLRCLCRRSQVGSANSVLNSMRGKVGFDCESYNAVIGGWARLGRVSEMEKCLKAMVDDGFSPDCKTYACVIEGLGRAGQVGDAVKVFESMDSEECRPDVGVYNAMIANCVSVGDFDECVKYYREMLSNECSPNLDTYVKLISGLIRARKVADALEYFDDMLRWGITPATGTVTSFIESLCNYGPPHAAMMIYKNARKGGCRMSLAAYKLLFMRLSRFGKCGMILKLWSEMQEDGYSSDMEVYEYVIDGLCNNGQLDTAVFVMEEALCKGFCPSRLCYSKLNNKLVASDKAESAYKLIQKIKQARINDNARRYWRAKGWHF